MNEWKQAAIEELTEILRYVAKGMFVNPQDLASRMNSTARGLTEQYGGYSEVLHNKNLVELCFAFLELTKVISEVGEKPVTEIRVSALTKARNRYYTSSAQDKRAAISELERIERANPPDELA